MGKRATGSFNERLGKTGVGYHLRFTAYGERRSETLNSADGWTAAQAKIELENILADVRRGTWMPSKEPPTPEPLNDPTFHAFASEWLDAHRNEIRENTYMDYRWQLTDHLLPFFAEYTLSQITVADVDRYRQAKVREDRLSPESINKTIMRLGQILDLGVEYELIQRNPARGKRRLLKVSRPRRAYLDRADQIIALLEAARELEAEARADRKLARPVMLAALVFAGPRIGELLDMRMRDLDLASGRVRVRESKTDAGVRWIELLPVLLDELSAHKARCQDTSPDAFLFPSASGGQQNRTNTLKRVLHPAVKRANERLEAADQPPLPEGLTQHALRRTCTSIRLAIGEEPRFVMDQMGHSDPTVTLRIYAQVMQWRDGERERLRTLVEGVDWAQIGTKGESQPTQEAVTRTRPNEGTAD
jgi:integrase